MSIRLFFYTVFNPNSTNTEYCASRLLNSVAASDTLHGPEAELSGTSSNDTFDTQSIINADSHVYRRGERH